MSPPAERRLVPLPSLDGLYAVEPEGFVSARNALAKELRAAGDRDTAAAITALRRPSVAAWALNQVARRHADVVTATFEAATAVSAALAEPTSGDLRAAQRSFRSAVETAVGAALTVASDAGRPASPGLRQAVQALLQTAAVDPEVGAALGDGVLSGDESSDATGFPPAGDAPGSPSPATPPPARIGGRRKRAPVGRASTPSVADDEAERLEAARRRRRRLEELRAEASRLDRRTERLAAVADAAEAAAEAARADADAARAEADEVRAALRHAERDDD